MTGYYYSRLVVYSNIRHLVSLWHRKRPFVSAVEEYELEKMNYSIPYNKRTTNELLRIAANGFIPNKTKLRGPDRWVYTSSLLLLVFRSQKDTGGGALCTWKEDCEKDHHHQDIVFRAGSVFSRRLASGDAELTAQQIIDHHRADDGLGDFWR
jgi:hypothetical protein